MNPKVSTPTTRRVLAAATALPLALLLAACDGDVRVDEGGATPTEPTVQEPAETESADDVTEEATEDDAPDPGATGTRANPAEPGVDTLTFSEQGDAVWEVSLGAATLDAWPVVQAENQFNDPPQEGFQYVLLPVTATYRGDDTGLPWIEIDVSFVAPDGRSFDRASAVVPDSLTDVAELYEGGTGTGNVLFEVPADQIDGATWAVKAGWFSDRAFFAVR